MRPGANEQAADPGDSKFYRLELFEGGELTQIQFFDSHEFAQAKQSALDAVRDGTADHAEVRDDASRLVFHPAGRPPLQ